MEQRQVFNFTKILALALPTCDKRVNFASKMGNNADAMDSMLPRAEVARTCGVSLATIRRWHELGDIRAEKRGTCWFYSLEDALARANQGPDDESTLDLQSSFG